MSRSCEVCAALAPPERPPSEPAARLRRICVGTRIVALCPAHADAARQAGAADLPELRSLFAEPAGNRSQLDRRSPLDRRIFPPRPEGRRRGTERRTGSGR
jgi:hypothetical protein